MESDWWLELENTYEERMKQRSQLLVEYGNAVLQAMPGSELACKELMEMALQFLCARYPHYFKLDTDQMVFHNNILGTKTNLKQTPSLDVLFQNIPEDFAIMMRDEKTGYYVFRAGIICSALGWNVRTKIGLQLHEIHAPVPDYKEKMQFSMDRSVFSHLGNSQLNSHYIDTLRRCRPTNPSNGVPGVSKLRNLSSCLQETRMSIIEATKCRTSNFLAATCA
jgi:hypothetical protein